jgi:phosphopantothenoylcysteine decarboxylase/phosphopantothenate--cysteine ligase
MDWKKNRRILLGISGGIAAYKAPDLVRGFRTLGNEVEVVLTEAAEKLVSPVVLSTLSGRRTWRQEDFLGLENGWKIPHITLSEWAEVVLVAPCTANMLRRAANGEAETLLGALLLAARKPVLLCPAMNNNMWEHPSTRKHIEGCLSNGYKVLEPDSGSLACGTEGKGRLPQIGTIIDETWRLLSPKKDLEGKKVLVTAGPTWEFLDPVRFLSNPSSGKMGYAMARTAWYRGADVTLVSGPVSLPKPHGINFIPVVSAEEMKEAVLQESENADFIVKAAAVGDYRPRNRKDEKMKRLGKDAFELVLDQNPDIAALIGSKKREGQILIGFAAESHDIEKNATDKISRKNLDLIVANRIIGPSGAFGADENSISIIGKNGQKREFAGPKEEAAWAVWDFATEAGPRFAAGN